jgi:hypothetical protein
MDVASVFMVFRFFNGDATTAPPGRSKPAPEGGRRFMELSWCWYGRILPAAA